MPPLSKAMDRMRAHLMLRYFPSYLGVDEYVPDETVEGVADLTDGDLDKLLEQREELFFETGLYGDEISLATIGLPTVIYVADDDEQRRTALRILLTKMVECQDDLLSLNFEQLKDRYDKQILLDAEFRDSKANTEDRGRFFSEASSAAIFSYWDQMPVWSTTEAAALILGKDPRFVNEKTFKRHRLSDDMSPFVREFHRLVQVIGRARQAKLLVESPSPSEIAAWTIKSSVIVSSEFSRWRSSNNNKKTEELTQPLSLGASERHSLYKIILGLAAAHYGYLPKDFADERNGTYSAITENANLAGFSALDVKTVRKCLKQAAEWAHQEEVRLTPVAVDKLRGKSLRKSTFPDR